MTDDKDVQDQELFDKQEDTVDTTENTTSSTSKTSQAPVDKVVTEKAKQYGHISKEEWVAQGRDPDQWKSPEEFVEYGEHYKHLKPTLDGLKKTISQQQKDLEKLVSYQDRVVEREREKAKQEVLHSLQQAKEMGNIEAVEHFTKQSVKLEDEQKEAAQAKIMAEMQSVNQAFVERNKHWFNDAHPELMTRASALAAEIPQYYPGLSYAEIARRVEERMRSDYPDLVGGQTRQPPVISSTKSAAAKSVANNDNAERTFTSLDEDLKDIYEVSKRIAEKEALRRGDTSYKYTKAMYIAKLKKDGEIR